MFFFIEAGLFLMTFFADVLPFEDSPIFSLCARGVLSLSSALISLLTLAEAETFEGFAFLRAKLVWLLLSRGLLPKFRGPFVSLFNPLLEEADFRFPLPETFVNRAANGFSSSESSETLPPRFEAALVGSLLANGLSSSESSSGCSTFAAVFCKTGLLALLEDILDELILRLNGLSSSESSAFSSTLFNFFPSTFLLNPIGTSSSESSEFSSFTRGLFSLPLSLLLLLELFSTELFGWQDPEGRWLGLDDGGFKCSSLDALPLIPFFC